MSRYIDADALKKELQAWAVNLNNPKTLVKADAEYIIDSAPTIDIVRCKECKWLTKDQYDEPYCGFHSIGIYADDFCSYGERKER